MDDPPIVISRVKSLPDLHELLSASLVEEQMLVRRTIDDYSSGANRFDRPGEALFIAAVSGRIVGMCGLNVDPYLADDSVGRVRHLYVLPACRRRAIGRALVAAVMSAARGRFLLLRIRTSNPAANALYAGMGFHRVDDSTATHEKRV